MAKDEIRRQELSNFLRTRRARIRPEEAGLPPATRRRTPGLRREEVAQLAGVSTTWYTWLEQKRPIRASTKVLNSLAMVLRLDDLERAQLFRLASQEPEPTAVRQPERVSPLLERIVTSQNGYAIVVLNQRWDLLAWNQMARAFWMDFDRVPPGERNFVGLCFTNSEMRSRLVDWPSRGRDILARFRADYGRNTGDMRFVRLVESLKAVSRDFAQWWVHHDLIPHAEGRKLYNHPAVGRVRGEHITLSVSDNAALKIIVVAPSADTAGVAQFREILEWFEAQASEAIASSGERVDALR
jgi:transcriptional regulator with XRE-family HTH domain